MGEASSGGEPLSPQMKRDYLALAMVLANMPPNLFGRPFKGAIAVAELLRVCRAVAEVGGRLSWTDGSLVFPLPVLETVGDKLRFGEIEVPVVWVLFHRSVTAGFGLILLQLREEARERLALICAEGAPLLDPNGLRLAQRHFGPILNGAGELGDYLREVEGVAQLMQQPNPLEAVLGRSGEGGEEG